jgi:hypothetical protein
MECAVGTDLKKFVRRALMETRGIELDPDEIMDDITTSKNPITGKIDVHATVVLKAPPLRIVITAGELKPEEKSD